jgi:hypothetical protein
LKQPFFKNIKILNFQIFPKSWLREVHACQKILKFEVFSIFVYFFDVFSARGGWVGMREKSGHQPF